MYSMRQVFSSQSPGPRDPVARALYKVHYMW